MNEKELKSYKIVTIISVMCFIISIILNLMKTYPFCSLFLQVLGWLMIFYKEKTWGFLNE